SLSRSFLLASVLPVLLAKAASATIISTPPVIPDDNVTFFCLVTNVSAKTLDIQIDVFDMDGGTSGHFGFVTPPLATRAALGHGASGDRFCQIAVDGGEMMIRASVEILWGGLA